MVGISSRAASLVQDIQQQQGIPQDYGVRIAGEEDGMGGVEVSLSFAEAPEAEERVTEEQGTRLFVEPQLAELLDEVVLDVEESDGEQALILRERDEAAEG